MPAPDYEDDLVFPPSMPRCDIEELQKKLDAAITAMKEERDKYAYELGVSDTKFGQLLRLLIECRPYIAKELYTLVSVGFAPTSIYKEETALLLQKIDNSTKNNKEEQVIKNDEIKMNKSSLMKIRDYLVEYAFYLHHCINLPYEKEVKEYILIINDIIDESENQ